MAESVTRTQYPELTESQRRANQMALALAKIQQKELQRRMEITERMYPQIEQMYNAILSRDKTALQAQQQQLGLMPQQIELERTRLGLMPAQVQLERQLMQSQMAGMRSSEAGREGLQATLSPTDLSEQMQELRSTIAKKELARLRGEKPDITPEQEMRLTGLEERYKKSGKERLTGLQAKLDASYAKRIEGRGLKPSGIYGQKAGKELGYQIAGIERGARGAGLQARLDLPYQNRQMLEGQRQFGEQLGQQELLNRYNAQLGLITGGRGIPTYTGGMYGAGQAPIAQTTGLPMTYQGTTAPFSTIAEGMKRAQQQGVTETTTYSGGGGSPVYGAWTGGLGGAAAGATIGAAFGAKTGAIAGLSGGPLGAVIGGIGGAIFGAIYS